jgi:hypothetical protein
VSNDNLPVFAEVNIGLQDVGTNVQGRAEGTDGVLSVSSGKSPVRYDSRSVAVKKGHNSLLPVGVLTASISPEDEQSRVRFGDD